MIQEKRYMKFSHDEDLIRENWVPIDIAHILYQIGVDVFELIKK